MGHSKDLGNIFQQPPYAEIAALMAALREQEGIAARALEFAILTATRTGESALVLIMFHCVDV
jgi:hypothetical protein